MPASCLPDSWIWAGKLAPPSTLLGAIPRKELLASMQAHIGVPLTLMVAPAGYGKTTLLMQWRDMLLANSAKATVAWLSMDEADAEPNRFLSCLILALENAGLALGHLPRLARSQTLDAQQQRTVSALLQILMHNEHPVTLLIDDYNAASDAVDAIMQTLREQAGQRLQLVVASRSRPAWPLARWKTRGWVHELSARELSLSLDETASILGTDVAPADVRHLYDTTEGWAVAVQLARLWRDGREGSFYGLTSFSGRVEDVAEYLAEQIVAGLSQPCQAFLLETALLTRFNAELADTVRDRHDSLQMLEQLTHLHPLLIALDAERQWFRYHSLLGEFLRQRLDTRRARHIHRAAAQCLADGADWVQAINHALKAGDTALAVSLVVRAGGWSLILRHGIRYTQALVKQFDETTQCSEPDLLLLRAYLHAKLGDHALCSQLLHLADATTHRDPRLNHDFQVVQTLARAYADQFEQTVDAPRGPSSYVSANAEHALAHATLECVHALAALTHGELDSALQTVRAARVEMRMVSSLRGENFCRIHEARALALAGRVEESRDLVNETLTFADDHFGKQSSLKALVGCVKAQHHYWQGDWAETAPWLQDGWDSLEHADGWLDVVVATAEVTWRVALRAQGMQVALRELEHLTRLATRRDWPRLTRLVQAWRVDVLVQSGQLAQARQEAVDCDLRNMADQRQDWRTHEAATLALTRLLMTTGASSAALARLQCEAAQLQDKGLHLPAWRLQLMALAAQCKTDKTLHAQDVVRILAPMTQQTVPGLLLEVGPCLLPALDTCKDSLPALSRITSRLRGWRAHPVRPKAPLSAKETRIVALLASGQSNKTIAQALDISANTVKFHLKHIFAKLAVDNRAAAISAALRQGLLDLHD
ncbi:MAG TPA: LuxR C-terminal-related transcriptional regulator [Pseudomonas sp.]|uniref:LuxR C-terminal-related transcriptional regulator n=1 Tax=Pseudomonas sp. TaxID=306 RepID=UPI002EDB345C